MSKSKSQAPEELVDITAELEQFEESAALASDFIFDEILPLLDEFEENNEDPNYIYGVATHGLFVELIHCLMEMGYTEKELKKELKIHMNSSFGQTLH